MSLSKEAVLSLYRSILRRGNNLQYTDKSYYMKRVRAEFEANRHLTNAETKDFYFNVSYL